MAVIIYVVYEVYEVYGLSAKSMSRLVASQKKAVVPNGHENRGTTARGRRSSFPDCDGPLVYL